MDDLDELTLRVNTNFERHQNAIEQALGLQDSIVDASDILVQSLLNDGKLLVCGNGAASALAQLFSSKMINRFERERPSLPAITLSSDSPLSSAIADDTGPSEVFSKQIRALAHPGDTLLVISSSGNASDVVQAVQAAHEKELLVIALTGQDGGDVGSLLGNTDIEIRVTDNSVTRVQEVHLLVIHCLCDLIDQQLFGSEE